MTNMAYPDMKSGIILYLPYIGMSVEDDFPFCIAVV